MKKYLYFILFFCLLSCDNEPEQTDKPIDWNQKKSTDFNKELAIEEQIQIKLFLEQHKNWKMTSTGTGLQYFIYEEGNGEQAKEGLIAQVEMEVTLLDGTACYKTASDEIEEFVIDKSAIETGIQEGIKKMRVGDRAKLIIPFHLAHGLIGDMDKIPPLTTIVVDIYLIDLKI